MAKGSETQNTKHKTLAQAKTHTHTHKHTHKPSTMLRLATRTIQTKCRVSSNRPWNGICWLSSSGDKNNTDDDAEEWIPPSRPLAGDQGHSKMYKQSQELQETEQALEEALFVIDDEKDTEADILAKLEQALALEEQLEQQLQQQQTEEKEESSDTDAPVDWLATRRAALGEQPEEAVVPVLHHMLLTESEMTQLLESLGGTNVAVLLDDPEAPRMGGAKGMVLCTALTTHHIRSLTKSVVEHLKDRKLQDLGVLGAQIGSHSHTSSSDTSNWNVVDCHNYIVHIFDEPTRQALNLEYLWSGKDPIWKLNMHKEEALDDYVADHPVPADYGPNSEQLWDIGKLQRSQFVHQHNPVVPHATKIEDSKAGKRRRREQRQTGRF
jgi:ribosomal silencing factor RsfS